MDSIVSRVDQAFLAAVAGPAPSAKKSTQLANLAATVAVLPYLLDQFSINTAGRIEQFVAQVMHECDGLCTTREYADGSAYEGRLDLGNTQPGDGTRYRGRGLIQLTGRANYRAFTAWMRKSAPSPDFEAQPALAEQFPWAVWTAIYFWTVNGLNAYADRGDILAITRKINGGKNGLDDRQRREAIAERYLAAKAVVTPIAADIVTKDQHGFVVLYRGIKDRVDEVEGLQRMLAQAGTYHLAIDGDFGAGTENAVKAFQASHGLKADGLAGEKTFIALGGVTGGCW